MSETRAISSIMKNKENKYAEITRQKREINEETENSEVQAVSEIKLEHSSMPQFDESKKNFDGAPSELVRFQVLSTTTTTQQQHRQKQIQQSQVGECNLLPVLVDRLRSALELSYSTQNSDDQLHQPLEDCGVDSKQDFRLWTSALSDISTTLSDSQPQQKQDILKNPKLDLKFLEDILISDIHTALAKLQDTLKRVDIGTLTRYNASLDPSNKLYLLRLISNLLAKLKVPEDTNRFHAGSRRRKNDRHTINVSHEEIIEARQWFDKKKINSNESSSKIYLEKKNEIQVLDEGSHNLNTESTEVIEQISIDKPIVETPITYDKGAYNDKYMKDAINQQQLLQIKNNRETQKENSKTLDSLEKFVSKSRRFNSLCKDDITVDIKDKSISSYSHQRPATPTRYNKILAKKSKIKRANTIDIPNYLQLKNDSSDQIQNGCFTLKRPIDVGDRIINGYQKVIPTFELKTDNDRKFLALINKNTDVSIITSNSPFKKFNYHQTTTIADKNWSSRFSNIKTNFDKPHENENKSLKKLSKPNIQEKFKNVKDKQVEKERTEIDSINKPYGQVRRKQNGFTHATNSPFQKIEKTSPKIESMPLFLKSGYKSKNKSMLQAKLKMFDQELNKNNMQNNQIDPLSQIKIKVNKSSENIFNNSQTMIKFVQDKKMIQESLKNGYLNCYPYRKQFAPFASSRSNSLNGKSNVNVAKSKLLVNFNKDLDKREIKRDKPKTLNQESKYIFSNTDIDNKRSNFLKQYSYRKSFESYPINTYQDLTNQKNMQNYALLEEKPPFNNSLEYFQIVKPENDHIKSEKLIKKLETSTQNVAVQTTYESVATIPPEANLIKSIVDLRLEYPEMQPKKLHNNVSIEISPDMTLPMQQSNKNCKKNLSNSNIISPASHTYQTYNHQPSVSEMANISNYSTREHISASNRPNYNYISNGNYHQFDNYKYQSIPHHYQSHENYSPVNDILHSHNLNEDTYSGISQKLYNEYSKLSDNQTYQDSSVQGYNKNNSMHNFSNVPYKDLQLNNEKSIPSEVTRYFYKEKPLNDLVVENIQKQDVNPEGIVTHYACAIATVSSMPDNTESISKFQSPFLQRYCEPNLQNTKKLQTFAANNVPIPTERKIASNIPFDEIHRHNMLQQSLIHRIQNEKHFNDKTSPQRLSQETVYRENRSPISPSFYNINYSGRLCSLNEKSKAQERINLFEDKRVNSQEVFRPLNMPPKLRVVSPTSVFCTERLPIRNNSSPIDSSDEYLMSFANKPTRNIVLSKSESWHQLAIAKNSGTLQLPRSSNGIQLKLLKSKSPSSLKLSKQFEASSASDNVRKMEEKIQRYFQGSSSNSHVEGPTEASRQEIKKRNIHCKKNMNNLSRSHTMPHLFDDKLFDENIDIDKAFDSIFKEATCSDDGH